MKNQKLLFSPIPNVQPLPKRHLLDVQQRLLFLHPNIPRSFSPMDDDHPLEKEKETISKTGILCSQAQAAAAKKVFCQKMSKRITGMLSHRPTDVAHNIQYPLLQIQSYLRSGPIVFS